MNAILEIGSNALKAIIYANGSVVSEDIYQIKFISNIDIISEDFLSTNQHFFYSIESILRLFNSFGVRKIKGVATHSLRGKQGANICDYLLRRFRLNIDLLSGEEEAEISGYGVIAGIHDADGILVDLGGGSIELAHVQNQNVNAVASFPFGIKTLNGSYLSKEQISSLCSAASMILVGEIKSLYLAGGYFRTFGKKYLEYIKACFKIIHNLVIEVEDFLNFIKKFKKTDVSTNRNRVGESNAVSIIEALVDRYRPANIVISNYGLKEGLRYKELHEEHKMSNSLLAMSTKLTGGYKGLDKNSYINLIVPYILNSGGLFVNLIEVIMMYLKYGAIFEAGSAGQSIAHIVLHSQINFSSKERMYVAIIVYVAYNARLGVGLRQASKKFLSREECGDAYLVGLIMYMHYNIDGFLRGAPSFKLEIIKKHILTVNRRIPQIIFDKIKPILKEVYIVSRALRSGHYNYSMHTSEPSNCSEPMTDIFAE